MSEFLDALADPQLSYLRYAVLTGLMASIAFGVVGTFVVARRITYIAGAVSHSCLGGIGAALFLQSAVGWTWCDPMAGAVVAAVLAALTIGLVTLYAREREDTVIGALWAVGMAVGILFISSAPVYVDPMSYLFGNIQFLGPRDFWFVVALDVVVLLLGGLFYHKLQAVCFDEEFARLRGVRVEVYYLLLLLLTALTVVLLLQVVGIVLMIALLTLPAAVAGRLGRKLWQMMALAVVLCALFVGGGLALSYPYNLPAGPTIIVLAGAVYLLSAVAAAVVGRLRR
jgi:zinc transport system permease protein